MLPPEIYQRMLDEASEKRIKDIWLEGEESRLEEPQVLFLGTQSTTSTKYKNCSAVYFFSASAAVLMDCAEGTYGQLVDYCGADQLKVDAVLRKTRVVNISHIHGDHNLGLPRFLLERDLAMRRTQPDQRSQVYVIVPLSMIEYVEYIKSRLAHPELVRAIPNHIFNPEKYYKYQDRLVGRVEPLTDKELVKVKDLSFRKKESVDKTIANFDVFKNNEQYAEELTGLHAVLKDELDFELMLSIETKHCP